MQKEQQINKLNKIEQVITNLRQDILLKRQNRSDLQQSNESNNFPANKQRIIETLKQGQLLLKTLQSFQTSKGNQDSSNTSVPKPLRSLMFIWQILNHILIDKSIIQTTKMLEVLIDKQKQITKLLSFTFHIRNNSKFVYHQSTTKCMLIFIYNYFYRLTDLSQAQQQIVQPIATQQTQNKTVLIKQQNQRLYYVTIINLFVMEYQNKQEKDFIKKDEQDWSILIINLILSQDGTITALDSQFENVELQSFTPYELKMEFYHGFASLISTAIQGRHTTQIVQGFPSHLSQIKLMYNQQTKISIKIGERDFKYLCLKLTKQVQQYLNRILIRVTIHQPNKYDSNQKIQKYIKDGKQDQQMMLLLDIIGQITFLGGYNMHLQQITTDLLMKHLLKLLQANYLIYMLTQNPIRNVKISKESSPYASEITSKNQDSFTQLNIQSLKKLITIETQENAKYKQFEFIPNDLFLKLKCLPQGILPLNLKILSNLIHINRKAQKYFEENLKYFHIVLGLTHNIPSQLTMRQWAIVFIRHVSECSQVMRQTLQKSKIDIHTSFDMKIHEHVHTVDL